LESSKRTVDLQCDNARMNLPAISRPDAVLGDVTPALIDP
jgi:hypothetical protein